MNIPTPEEFQEIAKKAKKAGQQAAAEMLAKFQAHSPDATAYGSCGGAFLTLDVDGRSAMGKFLRANPKPIPGFHVERAIGEKGFSVLVAGMTPRQEQSINTAAKKAVLVVLRDELGVKGSVRGYVD